MKTQIIQLEPHDDVISTRDKMGWGQTGRVVLVLPKGASILNRRLDLVLLQRHAASSGAQLALVTNHDEVRFYARELHIAAFNTLKEAQRQSWRAGRRRRVRLRRSAEKPDLLKLREEASVRTPAWVEKQPVRLGFFALGVLSFLAVILYLFPGASITLTPKSGLQETTLVVNAGEEIKEVTLTGKLPASWTAVVVEGRLSLPTTGKTGVPEETSSGFVRFTNLTEHAVQVPRGLVVMTLAEKPEERVIFLTTQQGMVPSGPGKSLVLAVRAQSPGKSSNVPANKLVAIEGPLGLELSAANAVATGGGTDVQVAAPSLKDIQKLRAELANTLESTALEELAVSLAPGDMPITSTLAVSRTLEESFIPELTGSAPYPPAADLELTLRLEFKVLVVSGENLQALAGRVLDAGLDDSQQPVEGTLAVYHLSSPALLDNGEYRWRLQVQRVVEARINPDEAVLLALGHSPENAAARLEEGLSLAEPPIITPVPSWWPFLPALPVRIEVVVRGQ